MMPITMEKALETHGLSVTFTSRLGPINALDDLNLSVGKGQVFGFLGPNGAGKTTTMHILLGFIAASKGEARIFGTDVRHSIARQRIGYLPENPETYRFLTGNELLTMAGRLFSMKGPALRDRADELLNQVGLKNAAGRRIATYSRGMLQRICLAQALINDPDLVILDEPTGGLDPIGRMEIRNIIAGLKERGKTVFFSSHELSEVELVCDHIAVLSRGRVVAEGKASELVSKGESLERYFMRIIRAAEEGVTA
jgi:ABC-2 type transport system ATP-binding protein